MSYLILVRHGESRWNFSNKFTGWVDVPLSENGIREAMQNAGELEGLDLDVAFTSKLSRAQETLLLILAQQNRTGIFLHNDNITKHRRWYHTQLDKNEIPIYASINLNERYYGKLQGVDKNLAKEKYGAEKVFKWRRGFTDTPPGGESLADVCQRAVPYFKKEILARVRRGQNIIVSAHGNSLRAIIKFLEDISSEEIAHLELVNGQPIIYQYQKGKLTRKNIELTYNRPIRWQ